MSSLAEICKDERIRPSFPACMQEWGCEGTHLGGDEDGLAGHRGVRDVVGILHDLHGS